MDRLTGDIYTPKQVKELLLALSDISHLKMMTLPPTPQQMQRQPPRIGRNEPCPCGSGKKFKKCCLIK